MSALRHIAIALVALVAGCSLIVDPVVHRVTNHCAVNMDCATSAHCDPATSMCVSAPTLPYELWLEVAPPNGSSGAVATPADLGPYNRFTGPIPLPVPPSISVRGTVRRDGVPITAQITFTETSAHASPIGARLISTRTMASPSDVDFATSVPSRSTYDVLVEPVGDSRASVPPYRYPNWMSGASDAALRIVLPTNEPHIEGALVDPDGYALVGFEVLAVDRASGALVSSVATTAATDAMPGHFAIALASTTTPFDIVVRPTSMRQATAPVPTYHVHPEALLPDAAGHVRILVPASSASIHWAGTVEMPESRGVYPVAGAVLQLHATNVLDGATGIVGTLDLTLTTDASGRYDAHVLPGTYTIVITPTADGDHDLGVLHEVHDLRPVAGASEILGQVFHLPLRTVLSGTVQSPEGLLVGDAHFRATALGVPLMGLTDPDLARYARSADALSGPLGDFRVSLDVGVYDLVVVPPDGSGFAWTVELGYGVGGSTATLSAPPMQLDAPVIIDGNVTWLDGGALTGAEVRAFAITLDHRAVMVGRATTDTHGHVRVLVPATLGH